ncbi:hypothetical protein P6B95_25130 [Streptomyces atratus]|uniref:hypothetical protein n=1 Tax=Streptomyces atratus TaxID=1893 RepID=UPI00166FF4FF|nr:hypothetical protein [Streptomyces atratus]WPW30333.1 hypothetical protein P6B95_25130 [Streptomyces atratus]
MRRTKVQQSEAWFVSLWSTIATELSLRGLRRRVYLADHRTQPPGRHLGQCLPGQSYVCSVSVSWTSATPDSEMERRAASCGSTGAKPPVGAPRAENRPPSADSGKAAGPASPPTPARTAFGPGSTP